jgi:hypothetical protein
MEAPRWQQVALVAVFVAALGLPLAGLLAERGWPRPALATLERLPAALDAFVRRHFGFRRTLVRWHDLASLRLLRSSPHDGSGFTETRLAAAPGPWSSRVLLGRDGWLFVAGGRPLESYRRTQPFTHAELAAWTEVFEARRAWLAARGIVYLLVVPPDKHNVYPEHMPAAVRPLREVSHLDQLLAHLRAYSAVTVVDVRPALLAAKARHPVFPRTDTHWNAFGAWAAYEAIVRALRGRRGVPAPWPLDAFTVRREEYAGGDLADALGLADVLREERVRLVPRRARRARVVERHPPAAAPDTVWRVTAHPRADLPRLVMFHDSFGFALARFLAEHFSEARFHLYRRFDPVLVDVHRPDVVIDEMVERGLVSRPPENHPALAGESSRLATLGRRVLPARPDRRCSD